MTDQQMTRPQADAVALLERWFAAWNAYDLAAIEGMLTDDVLYEDPAAPDGIYRGPEILDSARAIFRASEDFHLEMLECWATPDGRVIASWFRATGTSTGPWDPPGFAPTHGRLEFYGMDRSELREGKLSRHQIFYDLNGIARELGALPAPGTLADRLGIRLQHLVAWRLRRQARRAP